MNFADGDPSAYFETINPDRNPVLYTLLDGADPVAGEAIYTSRCEGCHGAPDDESGGPVAQAPSGGLLAYLQSDGKFSEFAHKVRWGVPDTIMTRASLSNPSSQEVVDLMKYLQDLSGTGYAITPGISGTWFDIDHDGEGFLIDVGADTAAKGGATMVAAYYTYDDAGGQAWMIGNGTITGDSVVLDMFITDGGIFGSAFDPVNVNQTAWGTLGFTFSDCENGVMTATPNTANQPTFETISYPITRVVAAGNTCP